MFPAIVLRIVSGAFDERMPQESTRVRIARHDARPDHVEVLARLLFIPRRSPWRERLKVASASRMRDTKCSARSLDASW